MTIEFKSNYFETAKKYIPNFIKHTFGLPNFCLHRIYREDGVSNSNVILVLVAENDPTGALSIASPIASLKLHSQSNIKVIYKTVSSINDMNHIIERTVSKNNRIQGLWIHAHGNSNQLKLGSDPATGSCNSRTVSQLSGLEKLEKNAVILLRSCKTGKESAGKASIAQRIAELAPGRLVIAPITYSDGFFFHFAWKDGLMNPSFKGPKQTEATGSLGKAYNVFHFCLYYLSYGYFGIDLTARYISHVKAE